MLVASNSLFKPARADGMHPLKMTLVLSGLLFLGAGCAVSQAGTINTNRPPLPMSFHVNIIKATQSNPNFRRVIFTGANSQLVVMSIPPGGEVGAETHKYTEQTLFFLSGTGIALLGEKTFPIGPGDVVVVVPGTLHNFKNTGLTDLKLYTVYAPPNHIDGRVHATKADADADTADEAVGEQPPVN